MIPVPLQNILKRLSVAWHERAIALKAISFALVGVVNTLIDFSIFWTAEMCIRDSYGTMVYVRCGPEGENRPKPKSKAKSKPKPAPKPVQPPIQNAPPAR